MRMTTYATTRISCSLIAAGLGTVLSSAPALAAGVTAGTLIENTASATFKSGSQTGTITSNTVVLKVDELLDVSVASLNASDVVLASGTSVSAFAVTNNGNGPEAFSILVDPSASGNQFNAVINSVVLDSNDNGLYEPGIDTVLNASRQTPVLSPDTSVRVFVVASLPSGATDGQTARLRLTGTALTGSGTPGTSFAGHGDGGGDAVVGLTTASATAFAGLRSSLATVRLTKSASVIDPFGGTSAVPGAKLTYRLVAEVTGSGTTEGLELRDIIPPGTTYEPGSLKLDGDALTDTADGDAGKADASGIIVKAGDVAGGLTKTVDFTVKIN